MRDKAGEGRAYGNLGNAYHRLGSFKQGIKYHNQHLSIAKEVGGKAGEDRAYGNLGNAYHRLGNFKQAIEYHKQNLSIAKEVEDRVAEGSACYSLGQVFELSSSICDACVYYRSSVKLFEQTRALLQSDDAWKIGFRDLYEEAYTAPWRTLLKNGETDETLCAADQGRAQALMDILKKQFGIEVQPSPSVEPKETVSYIFKDFSTQTVFMALDGDTINFWILSKGK